MNGKTYKMASEEERKSEIKRKPINLLDKILQKCQQLSVREEKTEQQHEKLLDCVEDKEEEKEEIVNMSADDPSSIVDRICCSDGTQSQAAKLKLLSFLLDACEGNPELYNFVGSSPLVYFAEKLLNNYTRAMDLRCDMRQRMGNDISELALLIPILKLLSLSANMSIQKIRAIFMYDSHLLLELMQAAVQCSYSAAATLKKLEDAVVKKNLAGALYKMEREHVEQLLTSYLGFDVASVDFKLKGYHVTLFEVGDNRDMNVNANIMKSKGKYTGTEASSEADPVCDCCEYVDSAEWSDIVVARVALLKMLFVYTEEKWQDLLADISSRVKEILHTLDVSAEYKHHVGAVYGFWSSVSFIHTILATQINYRGAAVEVLK